MQHFGVSVFPLFSVREQLITLCNCFQYSALNFSTTPTSSWCWSPAAAKAAPGALPHWASARAPQ